MAIKDLTIEIGKGKFAKTATFDGDSIELRGVDPTDIVALVTPTEIAEEAELGELLKAIIAKHGLNQLLYELMDSSETTAILDIVYDADDDITRTWAIDKFASESE